MNMNDPTEDIRRARQVELNSDAGERKILEARYGQVWNTEEMCQDFEVMGFMAPYVGVKRKSDGVIGSLEFQGYPRFYFNWKEHEG